MLLEQSTFLMCVLVLIKVFMVHAEITIIMLSLKCLDPTRHAEHPKIRQNTLVPPNAPFVICIQQTHKLNDSWVKTPIMTSGFFFPLTDKLELLDVGKRTACKLKPECRVSANKDGWGHTWIQHLSESRADVTSGSKPFFRTMLSVDHLWASFTSAAFNFLSLFHDALQ